MNTRSMKVRLALREEGPFWNAYLAHADTMDNAKLIGSISIGAVTKHPLIKRDFMKLMQRVMTSAIKEVTGSKPKSWNVGPAPESERSGNA